MNICSIRHIPYTNKHTKRKNIVDQSRVNSSQETRLHSASHYRCSIQQNNNITSNQGNMQLFEIQPYVGQLIKNQQQQFISSQMKKNPSFRVKNYHPQEFVNNPLQQPNQNQIQFNIEKIERRNRINFLGDLLQQMDGSDQQTKFSIVTELVTVPKKTPAVVFNYQNENGKLKNYIFIQSQQRIKQHTQILEQQKYIT